MNKVAVDRWYRLIGTLFSTLFVLSAFTALHFAYSRTIAPDFVSYWAAGRMTFEGYPASAYDIVAHRAVEQNLFPAVGYLPFVYPPPFLLIVLPFGIVPFLVGFAAWIAVTAGLYAAATRRVSDIRFAFAQAAAAANFIIGQNGFLSAAVFIRGLGLIETRPYLAGAILGLLSLKPQLALLLPVALLAGRAWRTIAAGALCSLVVMALGFLLFGPASYRGFIAMVPLFSHWLSAGRWRWEEIASTFALLRFFGVSHAIALAIHIVIALGAAALTAYAWARKSDARVPILAAATLLASPYLFTYDGLLLTLPMAYLLRRGDRHAFAMIWALSLLPIVCYFRPFPNMLPFAAMLSLWALHRTQDLSAISDGEENRQPAYQV